MRTEICGKKTSMLQIENECIQADIITSVRCCWWNADSDGMSASSLIIWRPACTELVLWRHRLRDCARARTHLLVPSCR